MGPPNTPQIANARKDAAIVLPASRYRWLWWYAVLITGAISLTPLIVMTFVNFHQYRKMLAAEMVHTLSCLTSTTGRYLEDFLEERRAALNYVASRDVYEDLCDREKLNRILARLKGSFGGFVSLSVIDSKGDVCQWTESAEPDLNNYSQTEWFHEVSVRRVHVSEVFEGPGSFPHFAIAISRDLGDAGDFFILRATIDTEVLNRHIGSLSLRQPSDVFLMSRAGVRQTPSHGNGRVFEECPIDVPAYSTHPEVVETIDKRGEPRLMAYDYIEGSPFIFVMLQSPAHLMEDWLYLRSGMFWLLGISVAVIIVVIVWRSTYLVNHIRDADLTRARAYHSMEYTNKMASIGRMAASVAHEINNPLAIINENAGLLKDLVSLSDKPPERPRLQAIVESILKSVERCSRITHRLLGFAKRMDPVTERITLVPLLEEVLSFQTKEAELRSITINIDAPDDLPTIVSDRGQLQQVFLNILSNAIAAVDNGGRIDIKLQLEGMDTLAVTITDNGPGIPEGDVERIFEPFFSTKGEYGTGLGLSITFGIVEKLGGRIEVHSEVGQGASFTVRLPVSWGTS